ncbi:CDP-glucose 4,6-dehydratase [Maridesulfovibrio ferrireducens]|uniref:CDP-glucose 4,6-dehydratase n=1 Tax=Maridesulfovibrio ferrireducens TaxID=246191 RepID=A0A1G9CNM2_9BACT|nr:CDP-glucose 4,6-dehydratase [Maridesulfovibrio ferrireducens]SDK53290.1 CDP-glucose 4,6-dehydratase [Maridesulfovibrio ferrireducens]
MDAAIESLNSAPWYAGKRVLVTGHTGFCGSWLSQWLIREGAFVTGVALENDSPHALYKVLGLTGKMDSTLGDIRDRGVIADVFQRSRPDIVFHLAAQPLVKLSYEDPEETFESNVLGTLNILRAAHKVGTVKSFVNITSDKAYQNNEWCWGYRENDRIGGHDPYSCSKACADLLATSFHLSYCQSDSAMSLGTARAGNIIGGGDWAQDRIIPDICRAAIEKKPVVLRNPQGVRPWQHVLEPLRGYMALGKALYEGRFKGEAFNFGPGRESSCTVDELTKAMHRLIGGSIEYNVSPAAVHEAGLLTLDIAKSISRLGWKPVLKIEESLQLTAEFYLAQMDSPEKVPSMLDSQIEYYCNRLSE